MPGMGELLIILAIVLVVFGARKLPAVGDALGRTLKNFKRGVAGDDELEVAPRAGGQLAGRTAPERDA
jgi:sec-independent protein translocase protein TatA